MMELEDIIEAACSLLKEGTLILHKSVKEHPKFKVYKKFSYDLYYMYDNKKEIAYTYEEIRNAPVDSMRDTWNDCDKLYLRELIKWFSGQKFKSLLKDGI